MNAKKSRNSRGKTRAMETHFYIMEFFFFFHQNFPMNIQNDSLLFFLMPCSYFQKNECKKNLDIREGTLKQWKPTSTQRFWQSSKKSEHEGKKSDSVKKAVQGKKSDFSKKKSKIAKKTKWRIFPRKIKNRSLFLPVAFFTRRFWRRFLSHIWYSTLHSRCDANPFSSGLSSPEFRFFYSSPLVRLVFCK